MLWLVYVTFYPAVTKYNTLLVHKYFVKLAPCLNIVILSSHLRSGFVLFWVLQMPWLFMTFFMTLGFAVIFKNFQNFTGFSIFSDLKQFNWHKLWYPAKFVPYNYSSLSYAIPALSSAVTNLPDKTLIFSDCQGPTVEIPRHCRTWKWKS